MKESNIFLVISTIVAHKPDATFSSVRRPFALVRKFVIALTMLRREESYMLPIRVFAFVGGRYTVDWRYVMAAAFLAAIPVAIVLAWLQRYLVRGVALGAVK